MNKIFTKIVGAALGLAMAIGVGVCVSTSQISEAKAESYATYTVKDAKTLDKSGDAPSQATFDFSTNGSLNSGFIQLAGKSAKKNFTLTLKGYSGNKITSIVVNAKSNTSAGSASLSVTAGTTTLAGFEQSAFNSKNWYGSWSTSGVDCNITMTNTNYTIKDSESVVILIETTVNSFYVKSIKVGWESGATPVTSLSISGDDITDNSMSILSTDTNSHTVNVAINSDATDKKVNVAHSGGTNGLFTLGGLTSGSIECNTSGQGLFTISGTGATSGSETFTIKSNSTSTKSVDLEVTALDGEITYHELSFDTDGGSVDNFSQLIEDGQSYTFVSPGTKSHYSFQHWKDDNSSSTYSVGGSITPNGDMSFTAIWLADQKYTITFDRNGGTGPVPTMSDKYAGETFDLPSASGLTNPPKVLSGWSDGVTNYNIGQTYTMPDHDVTFSAIWSDGWVLTTDVSTIKNESSVLFIAENQGSFYGMKTYDSGNNVKAATISSDPGNLITSIPTGVGEYTVYVNEDDGGTKYYNFMDENNLYLYAAGSQSSGNYLKAADAPSADNMNFNITNDTGTDEMTIQARSNNSNVIQYNSNGSNPPVFSCYKSTTTGTQYSHVKLYVKAPVEKIQAKTSVSLTDANKQYYNANFSGKGATFSTADLTVKALTASGEEITTRTITNGKGFTASLYSDSTLETKVKDFASLEAVDTYSFENLIMDSKTKTFYLTVTYNNITTEEALEIVVNRKNPGSGDDEKLHWTTESTNYYVEHLDQFKIQGRLDGKFNLGGVINQSEPVRIEIFRGNDTSGECIYNETQYEYTPLGAEVPVPTDIKLSNIENGFVIKSGFTFIGDNYVLSESDDATYTYRITLTGYTVNNSVTKTVNVYHLDELLAENASSKTYYAGQSYQGDDLAANVFACYNNTMSDEPINSALYSINNDQAFEPTQVGDTQLTVALRIDTQITTEYDVKVEMPLAPTGISVTFPATFTVGDQFEITSGTVSYGEGAPKPISSHADGLSFKACKSNSFTDTESYELSEDDILYKYLKGYYVFAIYEVPGYDPVHSESGTQLVIEDMTLTHTYTPAVAEATKVTSLDDVTTGTYVIVGIDKDTNNTPYALPNNNNVSKPAGRQISVSNNKITSDFTTLKWDIVVTEGENNTKKVSIQDPETKQYLQISTGGTDLKYSDTALSYDITTSTNARGLFKILNTRGLIFRTYDKTTNYYCFGNYSTSGPSSLDAEYSFVDLYKVTGGSTSDDPVAYIENVIDMMRLNKEIYDLCSAQTNPIDSTYWGNEKTHINYLWKNTLTNSQKQRMEEDIARFGNGTMSYADVMEKLMALYDSESNGRLIPNIFNVENSGPTIAIVVVSVLAVTAIGGYFFIRKRKELH